eukprot:682217-Karenia_brevis.AAC.1
MILGSKILMLASKVMILESKILILASKIMILGALHNQETVLQCLWSFEVSGIRIETQLGFVRASWGYHEQP